jgi:hypothetical protein
MATVAWHKRITLRDAQRSSLFTESAYTINEFTPVIGFVFAESLSL